LNTKADSKFERISFRVSASQREIIEQAAALQGPSLSEFVLKSASSAAENELPNQRVFEVDSKTLAQLHRELTKPGKYN
jgi:uncharacterized protein (DUF1778 family)